MPVAFSMFSMYAFQLHFLKPFIQLWVGGGDMVPLALWTKKNEHMENIVSRIYRYQKIYFYVCFGPNFGNFWWSVVPSVTFSSNISYF